MKKYLTTYCDLSVLAEEKVIRILIAGASGFDCANDGMVYRLLPLVVPELRGKVIEFYLVGPDACSEGLTVLPDFNADYLSDSISVSIIEGCVIEYVNSRSHVHQLVCFNHPEFKDNFDSWWSDGDLLDLFESSSVVVGCSRDECEASLDAVHLLPSGIHLVKAQENEFAFSLGDNGGVWAGTVWVLDASRSVRILDGDLLEVASLSAIAMGNLTHCLSGGDYASDCVILLDLNGEGLERFFWIAADLYLSAKTGVCVEYVFDVYCREPDSRDCNVVSTIDIPDVYLTMLDVLCLSDAVFSSVLSCVAVFEETDLKHILMFTEYSMFDSVSDVEDEDFIELQSGVSDVGVVDVGLASSSDPYSDPRALLVDFGTAMLSVRFSGDVNSDRRVSSLKGFHQNPLLVDTALSFSVEELALEYSDEVYHASPETVISGLLTESVNICRDMSSGLPYSVAESLSEFVCPVNPYLTPDYLNVLGLNVKTTSMMIDYFVYNVVIGLASSEVMLGVLESKEGDELMGLGSGITSYFDSGYESIQRADSVVDVELSDSGRFSSALSGLLAWGSDSNLSDVELKALVIKALDNMV